MATNNIRAVGYLPPLYHQKLREYMQSQSLTESAAIVAIVRQWVQSEKAGYIATGAIFGTSLAVRIR